MKQTAVEWLEEQYIKLESTLDAYNMYALFEQAKQMESEQTISKMETIRENGIVELSDEEIKEKMFGGQYDDQDINDVGEFEAAKWYREQLKQRQ